MLLNRSVLIRVRSVPGATLAVALLLSGCAAGPGLQMHHAKASNPTLDDLAPTPLDRYRAVTRPVDSSLSLAVHVGGRLSDAQKLAISELAQHAVDPGAGAIVIRIAAQEAPGSDAAIEAQAAADLLRALGAPVDHIQTGRYETDIAPAPVRISYRSIEAVGPDCRKGWDNFSATGSNRTTEHFGCAMAANLAAMVADPHDLDHPAGESPADATRRGIILGKYRKGETTSASKDEQASGSVSQAVK